MLSVLIYHLNSALLPGGFVGVDIFFVISGFLISGIIFTALDRGTFSILDFYRRRVQRIAPAMLVVVAFSLAAAQLLMLPEDAGRVAKSAVFSLASLANVYFWQYKDGGYFAQDGREDPLLHLWSLGVEEQFYIAWPLTLMAVGRRWRSPYFPVVATVVALTSFVLGDLLFAWDPSFVYYLPATRAGELLVGAILSAWLCRNPTWSLARLPTTATAAFGAILVLGALAFYNESNVFPGVRAIAPTVGTAMLILAGHHGQSGALRVLVWRPLVAVGLASYSVYLWHWPLLAFYRYGYGEVSARAAWVFFFLALAAGWLSYVLVERPTRAIRLSPWRTIVAGYVLPAAVVGGFGLLLVYGPRLGLPMRAANYLEQLADLRFKAQSALEFDYVCQGQRLTDHDLTSPDCVLGADTPGEPQAVLWGDSNASHYIGVVARIAERAGFRFRNLEIGSCPPLAVDPAPFVDADRLADCRRSLQMARTVVEGFPAVIISASWSGYRDSPDRFLSSVAETVRGLVSRGKYVVIMGKVPVFPQFDRRCAQKALTFPFLACAPLTMKPNPEVLAANSFLRQLAERTANVAYFDVTPYTCPNERCSTAWGDGEPMYYNRSHLTMAASWRLGDEIVGRAGVPHPFSAIAREAEGR